jgi:hypothetical protein
MAWGVRRLTSLLALALGGMAFGCKGADIVCAGTESAAIQVRVVDGLTGARITDATVTARYFIGGEGEAQIYPFRNSRGEIVPSIFGTNGLYEVTVKKSSYTDFVQRVTVPGTGGQCSGPITVDLTVHLFPVRS